MKTLAAFGVYLSKKRNFLNYSLLSVGVPGAAGLIWFFGDYGGVPYWLFLTALAFLGAYIWGLLMWRLFVRGILGIQDRTTDDH